MSKLTIEGMSVDEFMRKQWYPTPEEKREREQIERLRKKREDEEKERKKRKYMLYGYLTEYRIP